MAEVENNLLFDRRGNFKNPQQLSALALSDFITGSTKLTKTHPLNNFPYNIYKNAWEPEVPLYNHRVELEETASDRRKKFWWSHPNQDSIPVEFLESTSMHGLKYVAQPKRHLIERLFWMGSFLSCMVGAVYMISQIWQRYYNHPVIVTFNPTEQDLESIPFPAVTICNMNPFRKSRVEDFFKVYREAKSEPERKAALDALRVINGICTARESFFKVIKFASRRGEMMFPEAREPPSLELEKNLTTFLLHNTQPCKELLRFCVWAQKERDCGKIFKPIITDFGKCCTFNMLPQDLMEHRHSGTDQSKLGEFPYDEPSWTKKEIDGWSNWNYDADGYILNTELKYPRRQRRAGTIDGLSLLIDPDTENSFCPSTDSEGVKILFHVPLDAPRVADLGSLVGIDQEVYMEVNPDLTIADDGISTITHETRKCYFGLEYQLKFYKPYTRNNCMEECWSEILLENCKCVLYYTPSRQAKVSYICTYDSGNSTTSVCGTNPGSLDYKCVKDTEQKFVGRLNKMCSHCKYPCNDLSYNAEVTYAQLQKDILWGSYNQTGETFEWVSHRISVVHIFMGSDSTVPKLRQKLYQTVDLIANTGGLLGLSIGFSVLSAVEVVYFSTMRVCCKRLRRAQNIS